MRTDVILIAALAACSGGSSATRPQSAAPAEPAAGNSCSARAAELGRYLDTMDHDISPIDAQGLIVRDDLPKVELREAPLVAVHDAEVWFQGEPFTKSTAGSLVRAIGTKLKGPDPERIVLAFDAGTTWETVVEIMTAAHEAGLVAPDVLFERKSTFVKPARSKVDDDLDKLTTGDAANIATELSQIISTLIATCPAMSEGFAGAASEESGSKAGALIAAVAPALVKCDCNLDVDSLRLVLVRLLWNPHPVTAVTLRLDPKATPITRPAATPWREAHERITTTTTTTWFAVAP